MNGLSTPQIGYCCPVLLTSLAAESCYIKVVGLYCCCDNLLFFSCRERRGKNHCWHSTAWHVYVQYSFGTYQKKRDSVGDACLSSSMTIAACTQSEYVDVFIEWIEQHDLNILSTNVLPSNAAIVFFQRHLTSVPGWIWYTLYCITELYSVFCNVRLMHCWKQQV